MYVAPAILAVSHTQLAQHCCIQYCLSAVSILHVRWQSIAQERHKGVVSADGRMPSQSLSYDEEESKYARRAHPLKRTLQRLFPNLFAPGLPVTTR